MLTTLRIATDSTGERPASWFPCPDRPRFGIDRFFAAMMNRLEGQATFSLTLTPPCRSYLRSWVQHRTAGSRND